MSQCHEWLQIIEDIHCGARGPVQETKPKAWTILVPTQII